MYARFHIFIMNRQFQIISLSLEFLKIYTDKYGAKASLVKFIVYICSQGFQQNLVCIFLRLLQISMNFVTLYGFLGFI
jgi:hypothetical protein